MPFQKHDHGYDTCDNMGLMDLISSPAYAEIVDKSQIANPNPSADDSCSRYDFVCKTCGAMYHIYYDHKFVNGVCTRTAYCGGIAQNSSVQLFKESVYEQQEKQEKEQEQERDVRKIYFIGPMMYRR